MSGLTADRNTLRRGDAAINVLNSLGVEASTIIYSGALVCKDSSGYAVPASNTGGLIVYGVNTGERQNNSTGAAGAITCPSIRAGVFRFDNGSSITTASIGKPCYASDDHTVNLLDSAGVFAGLILDVDSVGVWVEVRPTQQIVPATFESGDTACTGSSQSVAHGLGQVPSKVLIVATNTSGTGTPGVYTVTQGSHTSTNVVFTGTDSLVVRVYASV